MSDDAKYSEFEQSRKDFGITALKVIEGAKKLIETLEQGYLVADHYPPGGGSKWHRPTPPPGGCYQFSQDGPIATDDTIDALIRLRDFTLRYYVLEREGR